MFQTNKGFIFIFFCCIVFSGEVMADWKYKGVSYYSSLRARLSEYSTLSESGQDIDKTKAISLYNDLPEIPYDLKIIEYGSSIIPEYDRHLSIENVISRISFPTIPEEEFLKILQHEPQIEEHFGYFEVAQELSSKIPVKVIFDKTFKIISSGDYYKLKIGNDSSKVNYRTMLNYLFDNHLWPNLPGLLNKHLHNHISGNDNETIINSIYEQRDRKNEFYYLINKKTPDEIQKYMLLVMMYYDGVPVIAFDENNDIEDILIPYEGDNLDNWQKAWNNTIPIICDFMSAISTPEGCEQYVDQ